MQDKPIKIVLADGVERELRWDFNTLEQLSIDTGDDPFSEGYFVVPDGTDEKGGTRYKNVLSLTRLKALLFAGLVDKPPDFTPQMLGALIPPWQVIQLKSLVLDAMLPPKKQAVDPTPASGLFAESSSV